MNDLFTNKHIGAALYFTDLGHYIFKAKTDGDRTITKSLAEPGVSAAFSHREFDSGWLYPGVVRAGHGKQGDWFVYFHEPTIRKIAIVGKTLAVPEIPLPATVMLQYGRSTFMFCLGNKTEFDPKAEAWHAPFANIELTGRICWGKNMAPKAEPAKALEIWRRFFESMFNNDLTNNKSKSHEGNINELLVKLDKKKTYPYSDLLIMGRNIGSIIERIVMEER